MADKFASDMLRLFNATVDEDANDRVVAIVCAAYIENYLTDLIRRKMPGLTPQISKRMFAFDGGSIATLGQKVDMALALEIILPSVAADAKLIGRIRNQFAHHLDVESFDHNKVRDLVDQLQTGREVTITDENGNVESVDATWSRKRRFAVSSRGVCSIIMHKHIDQYPYTFTDDTIPNQAGRKAPARTITARQVPNLELGQNPEGQ